MNELIAVEKIAQWQTLKALVLDSVPARRHLIVIVATSFVVDIVRGVAIQVALARHWEPVFHRGHCRWREAVRGNRVVGERRLRGQGCSAFGAAVMLPEDFT